VLPGSIVKIATLAAALEAGVIDERAAILCTRRIAVAGHTLACAHPDRHQPLRAVDALAHSCNVFFANVAARLSRASLDRALVSLGLSPSDPAHPVPAAALGIAGIRATPRQLLGAMVRVAADPSAVPWRARTLEIVREGLRASARVGTASVLGTNGIEAMAKTGTVVTAGVAQGIVVGVTPPTSRPATSGATAPQIGFVLLASGAAGMDAAALVVPRLRLGQVDRLRATRGLASAPTTLRVGIVRQGGGYAIENVALEEYVARVLGGEAARNSAPAALEALAITIRTFALANRGRHQAAGFDLCDLTHCQVLGRPMPAMERAASATAGRVLLYRGSPAPVHYTGSCGGHTERAAIAWPGAADRAFLPAQPDDACAGEPAWSSELSVSDLMRALAGARFKGDRLRDIRIAGRQPSGRVTSLQLDGLTPDEIAATDFRTLIGRTLGWQHVRSTAFDVERTATGFRLSGRGAGHGVGLCVIGSARRAARGESADAILAHYFPGLTVRGIGGTAARTNTDLRIVLPAAEQSERELVRALAERSRDALVARLGLDVPPRITLRFHPTVESYQRETGQPWFTAGATLDGQAHFIPLTALRARGLLERTVRHELVHILTGPALAGRPLWVIEGAASYFADETTDQAADQLGRAEALRYQTGVCPVDRDLRKAASAEALRTLYGQAAACFARELKSGTSWRDVN
jgi:SpoIID/LytB domain protein